MGGLPLFCWRRVIMAGLDERLRGIMRNRQPFGREAMTVYNTIMNKMARKPTCQ
jgi:hypothetical protein